MTAWLPSVRNNTSFGRRMTRTRASSSCRFRSRRPIALVGTTDGFAGLLDLEAAHLQADAQLEVGGHEGAAVLLGPRLEVLEDRLDLARRHGRAGQLARG